MTIKQAIHMELDSQEIMAIKDLKEKNSTLYSVEYKLDLSMFKITDGKINHLLCWDENELVGYAALSHFDPEELEVTIIAKNDREILQKMNEAWIDFLKKQEIKKILVIVDRKDSFVNEFIREINIYKYSFSEHSMTLLVDKVTEKLPTIILEPAKIEEAKIIAELEEFGELQEITPLDAEDLKKTLVLRKNGAVIASIRIENEGFSYGLYGFVVRPDFRGKGIGRSVLNKVIQLLLEKNAREIYLEVESTNKGAFNLYRSMGFEEKTLFDYYLYKENN